MAGGLKRRLNKLMNRVNPDQTRRALDQALGGGPDLLLVHSAFSGCGHFTGGPADVVEALAERAGTLVLPTHTYSYPPAFGQPAPIFDPDLTPSQNGILTEVFRKRAGSLRSINSTHSLAASGPKAQALIEGHELLDAPCGKGSPWDRLVQQKAAVLLFGVTFHAYTPYHTAEDAAEAPHAYEPGIIDQLRYRGRDGQVHVRRSRRQSWIPRRFREAGDLLEKVGLATRTPLGAGHLLFVPDSAKVHDFLVERLRKTPDFLYYDCAAPLE